MTTVRVAAQRVMDSHRKGYWSVDEMDALERALADAPSLPVCEHGKVREPCLPCWDEMWAAAAGIGYRAAERFTDERPVRGDGSSRQRAALRETLGAVVQRWYSAGLLRFNSHDDGSDDLLLRDELWRAALAVPIQEEP